MPAGINKSQAGCALKKWMLALPVAGLAAAVAPAVNAHFKLVEPASWLEQDERGDPQKLAPCGGTLADPGEPTAAVTAVTGGSKLKIVVNETIFHPGHYRISLARKRNLLPLDPVRHDARDGARAALAVGVHHDDADAADHRRRAVAAHRKARPRTGKPRSRSRTSPAKAASSK